MSDGMTSFGNLLRQLRSAASLSQEDLAERAGLSRRGVSDLERGARRTPRLETVRLLAKALNLAETDRTALLAAARPAHLGNDTATSSLTYQRALPTPLTRLIGREAEIASLRAALQNEDFRLITVTGPGGVGKTRLVVEVAGRLRDRFPGGVVFAELAPVRDPELVLAAVTSAAGVQDRGARPLRDSLVSALGERELLLVLDNCEHVLPATPLIADLLQSCPRLRVLATSRTPLGLSGERLWPVAPLALPRAGETGPTLGPAVTLFAERALAVAPDFRLTAANTSAVSQICRYLDGLPLAIELAAARMRLFQPAALLERLDRRLPLLTGGGRDLPPRLRTLADAIAWSHDLLSPAEQRLFRRLSVFIGGFTVEAVEAISPPDIPDPLAAFQALVDHSLVTRGGSVDGASRFGMLETIREYGLERLATSGEERAARDAHAAWCLAFAEQYAPDQFRDDDVVARVEMISAEHANLMAALAHFAATEADEAQVRLAALLGPFWFLRSLHSVGRACLERALARPSAVPAVDAAALVNLARLATFQGDSAVATAALVRAEERAEAAGDSLALAFVRLFQAVLAIFQGDFAAAEPWAAEAETLARAGNDPFTAAFARFQRARAIHYGGDLSRAEMLYREILAEPATPYHANLYRYNLGRVARTRGQHADALALYAASLQLFLDLGEHWSVATCLEGVATALGGLSRAEAATRLLYGIRV
jgi:predicted ATPase/DNA-binding XRE family transcriptional regulator